MQIPFSLPFRVYTNNSSVSNSISSAILSVELKEENDEAFDDIEQALGMISLFSGSGALQSPPYKYGAQAGFEFEHVEYTSDTQSTWRMELNADNSQIEQGWISCFFSILLSAFPEHFKKIKNVTLSVTPEEHETKPIVIDPDMPNPYLAPLTNLPFKWNIDDEYYDSLACNVEFIEPFSDSEDDQETLELINMLLGFWQMGISSGSMAMPFEIEEGGAVSWQIEIYDDDPFIDKNILEWSFTKIRCHSDAFNALARVFLFIHSTLAKIKSVKLED